MTSTDTFAAHGVTFRISSPHPEVAAVFADLLGDMRSGEHSTHSALNESGCEAELLIEIAASDATEAAVPAYRVLFDDAPVYETLTEGSVVSHVVMEINQRASTAAWSQGLIPMHASTVAGPSGAIMLAGASHSGKTTLAVALALAGPNPVAVAADEVSALEPANLLVVPYGKPAALRRPGIDLLAPRVDRLRGAGSRFERDERFVPLSELAHPASTSRPVTPLNAIIFPRFEPQPLPGAATRLVAVRPVDALARLMQLTLGSEPGGVGAFRTLERLVREMPAHDLTYSDAFDAVDHLAIFLGADATS